MQPVEPSTIVRGPAAFTISFMTSADSHPWHVRWPDVKYSSSVTFLTPRKGSRICVAFVNVVFSAMALSLYSRTPSQWVFVSDLPALAAVSHMSVALLTSSSVTSRPPRPQMKLSSGGRRSALYSAARISLATTPEANGDPKEEWGGITPTPP